MRIIALQTKVHLDKKENLRQLLPLVERAAAQGADLVTLGEMFNCPYQNESFPLFAEEEGGECWTFCSDLARKHKVYLSAGSMPERDDAGSIYNTAYVFDREGRQIAKHRKMHLFDIDVEGGQHFMESDTLSPGNAVTVFDTEFGKMGLCICYDFRFPELARLMALRGAKLLLVPAAFNMTTGPAHWELLFRQRAVDNQCFVIGTSPARDLTASYTAWGHTIAADPWGRVLQQLDEKEGSLIADVDLGEADHIRQQLPLLKHRRTDLYELREL